jgi:hypothetical protein
MEAHFFNGNEEMLPLQEREENTPQQDILRKTGQLSDRGPVMAAVAA